jgi:DNA-binding LacI/PurR family transcriptional regulator
MPGKVTIATVARRAKVSRQTVSNVVNSPHLVRQETRERVEAAIADLGYRANQAARQMRTGRSRLIAVRIEPAHDGINGSILDRFLHGLTEAAAPVGYRIMLYTAVDDASEIATYDELLAAYDLDAFVLTSTHHGDARTSWLASRDVPFVTFGRPWGAPEGHSWVDVDGAAGTAAATERLLGAGHRRIGFIGWPEGSGVGDDRCRGWASAMRDAGQDPAGLERRVVDRVSEAERVAADLLDSRSPTALVCASDSLALGALRATAAHTASAADTVADTPSAADTASAARTASVGEFASTGRAVAVIGFDDTPVAQAIGLTSVGQPLAEAARTCVELLARLLDSGGSGEPEHVLIRPHVVVRDSG